MRELILTPVPPPDNAAVADALDEVARYLEESDDNVFRAQAYRNGAAAVRHLTGPIREVIEKHGRQSLMQLPGIGPRLAEAIEQLTLTGRLQLLDDLRAANAPVDLLATVVGVGPKLAQRIHDELGVRSLEELEVAAHDGRLAQLPGMGEKRLRGIRDALAGRLRRGRRTTGGEPGVDELLEVDATYRQKAAEDALRKVAPRRLNPYGEAWLPVMGTTRDGWKYRAMYSNTPQAHRLGKTGDWVVIYFEKGSSSGQCTVVTAGKGPLKGQRVVRGREDECMAYHGLEGKAREALVPPPPRSDDPHKGYAGPRRRKSSAAEGSEETAEAGQE